MQRKSLAAIRLTDQRKKALGEAIEAFYQAEYGERIGLIMRERILELFLEELGPVVYNQALDDAQHWFTRMRENLEVDYELLYKRLD